MNWNKKEGREFVPPSGGSKGTVEQDPGSFCEFVPPGGHHEDAVEQDLWLHFATLGDKFGHLGSLFHQVVIMRTRWNKICGSILPPLGTSLAI